MSKQLSITWQETATYTQVFTVDDDFDPATGDLEALIVEDAQYVGPAISVDVDERDVVSWAYAHR